MGSSDGTDSSIQVVVMLLNNFLNKKGFLVLVLWAKTHLPALWCNVKKNVTKMYHKLSLF